MMRKIIVLFIIISNNVLYSQYDVAKIFPSNPQVSSILKMTNQEINQSNGQPVFSLPLFNIENGDINYPIKISYNFGGIRVDGISSNIGLGWGINDKSMVTRVVKDFADDLQGKGYMTTPYTTNLLNQMQYDSGANVYQLKNSFDSEPDEFILNIPNRQIKFYYDRNNGTFLQIPLSDVKIESISDNNGLIRSWVIILENGTKYFFGGNNSVEFSSANSSISVTDVSQSTSNSSGEYITSWYITQIEDVKGNKVEFFYKDETPYYLYSKIEESKIIHINDDAPNPVPYNRTYNLRFVQDKFLEKIQYKDIEVLFLQESSNRQDLYNGKALNSVSVKKQNQQIKKVIFNHSYFQANSDTNYDNSLSIQTPPYRLKLDNIEIFNGSTLRPEKYIFEYDESINLPRRYSYSQDAWGFYNGKQNYSLIPRTDLYSIYNIHGIVGDADRSVSLDHSTANVLKKIYYPTGGGVEFEYELNDASVIANLTYPFNFSGASFKNEGLFAEVINTQTDTYVSDQSIYYKNFTITNPKDFITVETQIEGCMGGSFNDSTCAFSLQIKNTDTNTVYQIYESSEKLLLTSGNYEIKAIKNTSTNQSLTFGFITSLFWEEFSDLHTLHGGKTQIGGLRVKSYRLFDTNYNELLKKNFYYTKKNNIGEEVSSGVTNSYPVYIEKPYYRGQSANGIYGGDDSSKISSNNLLNNSFRPVTYEYVKEEYSQGQIGSEINQFTVDLKTDAEFVLHGTLIDDKTNFTFDWRNGLLKEKTIYDNSGKKIKRIINDYSSKRKVVKNDFGCIFEYREIINETPFYKYQFYPMITEHFILESSTEENYVNNVKSQTQTTINNYNNLSHNQQTSQLTTFPDSTIQETTYQYAHEKNNQYLIDKNMIGIPLQTTVTKNNLGISSIETKYPTTQTEANTKTTGLPLPTSVVSYGVQIPGMSSTSTTEVTYDKYDNKGNILQYTLKGLQPTVIIWGYNQTQPIAKIEGISYDALMALSGVSPLINDTITKSNSDATQGTIGSEQSLLTSLDSLRTSSSLNAYMISTYTYDPLIGVTSITPPSGIREIYKYDSANRLQSVVDVNGKILKEYQYNYKQ
ncbi:hypothetical protein [Cloacibacterium normanense]|uniref:hypothetical protein n=1 Tax=Cloacibacterium normanense TaxID=237258 RepID=UPI00352F1569